MPLPHHPEAVVGTPSVGMMGWEQAAFDSTYYQGDLVSWSLYPPQGKGMFNF